MKIDIEVLKELNANIGVDLIAINEYFLHARMLKHWGYMSLGAKIYHRSIEVMKYCDDLVQRIFLLEGLPNLQKLGKLFIGQTVPEILQCDLKLERDMHEILSKAILTCEKLEDFVSRELLLKHLHENEEYIDWLETQHTLITDMGLDNYLENAMNGD